MDKLLDTYLEVIHEKEFHKNCMVNQYNVAKVALLIYRICWRIEGNQVYSLITKCQLL